MGVDLRNDRREYLGLTWDQWGLVYELAMAQGWQPSGTLPNRAMIRVQLSGSELTDEEIEAEVERTAAEWKGSYFYNEYQIVDAADAASLAAALERALSAAASPAADQPGTPSLASSAPSAVDAEVPAVDDRTRDLIGHCIRFFRGGRFRIG